MQESLGRQGISVSFLYVCLCESHLLPMKKRNTSTIQTAACQIEHLRGFVSACVCVCTCVSCCSCPQHGECLMLVSNTFPGGAI